MRLSPSPAGLLDSMRPLRLTRLGTLAAALAIARVPLPTVAHAGALQPPHPRREMMSTTVQQVPTGTYLVDPVHSNVGFSIKAAGLSGFRGTFGAYDARLDDGVLSGSG